MDAQRHPLPARPAQRSRAYHWGEDGIAGISDDQQRLCFALTLWNGEYFHGDNGAGLGASHQTGWTGLIARIIQLYGVVDPQALLKAGVARQMSSAA